MKTLTCLLGLTVMLSGCVAPLSHTIYGKTYTAGDGANVERYPGMEQPTIEPVTLYEYRF